MSTREPIIHEKKLWPEFFGPVQCGEKLAEIRLNDSDYRQGDTILFREYNPGPNDKNKRERPEYFALLSHDGYYTGAWVRCEIKHVLKSVNLLSGYVCLSLALGHHGNNYSGFDAAWAGKYADPDLEAARQKEAEDSQAVYFGKPTEAPALTEPPMV